MGIPRVYIDTSVVGGVFNRGKETASARVFGAARNVKIRLVLSEVLFKELKHAPIRVQDVLGTVPQGLWEVVYPNSDVEELFAAYLTENIVPRKFIDDALHVAFAAAYRCDFILSWNFKHLVNPLRIARFNAVNPKLGYNDVRIISPTMLRL